METQHYGFGTGPAESDLFGSLYSRLRSLYLFFLYSSLLVAFAACGMAYTADYLEGIPATGAGLGIMFLVAFSVYNLNRKTDMKEDAVNHAVRFAFTSRFGRPLYLAACAAYLVAGGIAFLSGPLALLVTLIPLCAGIVYSVPLLPAGFLPYRRLKEIPVMKNLIVTFAWSLPLTCLPIALSPGIPVKAPWVTLGFFSMYVFTASILPDIRDCRGDALAGVNTIPVLIGEKQTRAYLVAFNIVTGSAILILGIGSLPSAILLTIAAACIYIQVCIRLSARPSDRDLVCDFLSDGQFILFAGTIWLMDIM
jgi:4-hydroxybenzoate polyprenyltransferase